MNRDEKESTCQRLAIIGAGSIGCNFALVFSTAGHTVRLCEVDAETRNRALERIAISIGDLREFGLCIADPDEILSRISVTSDLGQAVGDAAYVQECVPENPQLKRKVFRELELLAPVSAVLASSSSAILASNIAAGLETAERCLVAHPGNPPSLIRVVEVVPAPFTSAKSVDRACTILRSAGMATVD